MSTLDAIRPDEIVAEFIGRWEPPESAHCSNCAHARVGGTAEQPMVRCAAVAAMKPVKLLRVIRSKHPLGFQAASKCNCFEAAG